ERAFAAREVFRLAGRFAYTRGFDAFENDPLSFVRVFLQIGSELVVHRRFDETLHLAVAELRLGLTLELGLRHLDADDRRQPLAYVFALQALRVLLEDRGRDGERVQRTGEPRLESDEMGAAFDRAD